MIERHAEGLDARPHRAAGEARSCASRCSRCCTPSSSQGDRPIPPEGAIDEAVETAKAFCGADAPGFVNGILGAVLRAVRENGRRS